MYRLKVITPPSSPANATVYRPGYAHYFSVWATCVNEGNGPLRLSDWRWTIEFVSSSSKEEQQLLAGNDLSLNLRNSLSNLARSNDIKTELNSFADDKTLQKEYQFWGRSTDCDPVSSFAHLWTITNTWQFVDSTYSFSMGVIRSFIMIKCSRFFS